MTRTQGITALAATFSLLAGTVSAQSSGELETPVRLEADGAFIDTGKNIAYAGPLVRDHDGDGLPDLLVSAFGGNVRVFKNVGTRAKPEFEEQQSLQAEGKDLSIKNW